jgi:hypothetical protein
MLPNHASDIRLKNTGNRPTLVRILSLRYPKKDTY